MDKNQHCVTFMCILKKPIQAKSIPDTLNIKCKLLGVCGWERRGERTKG